MGALLGRRPGETVPLTVGRGGTETRIDLSLAAARPRVVTKEDRCWQELGVKVEPQPAARVQKLQSRYRGGLLVTDVREGGPASDQGIRIGDILVGLHVWETIATDDGRTIFDRFPGVQFYDYTKIANRRDIPANYDLTFSWSGISAFAEYGQRAVASGMRVAVVFKDRGSIPAQYMGMRCVDGDDSDIRHLDPQGVVVALYAKGKAKRDTSGFVIPIMAA